MKHFGTILSIYAALVTVFTVILCKGIEGKITIAVIGSLIFVAVLLLNSVKKDIANLKNNKA